MDEVNSRTELYTCTKKIWVIDKSSIAHIYMGDKCNTSSLRNVLYSYIMSQKVQLAMWTSSIETECKDGMFTAEQKTLLVPHKLWTEVQAALMLQNEWCNHLQWTKVGITSWDVCCLLLPSGPVPCAAGSENIVSSLHICDKTMCVCPHTEVSLRHPSKVKHVYASLDHHNGSR